MTSTVGAEPLELARRARRPASRGPRDDDAPAGERLLSHGSPPGSSTAPAASASRASRSPTSSGSPSPSTRTTSRPSGEATSAHAHVRSPCNDCYWSSRAPARTRRRERCSRRRASRRKARSAVVSARAPGSSIAARSSSIALVVGAALDRRARPARRRDHRLGVEPLGHRAPRARAAARPQPRARPRRTRPPAPCGCACPRSRVSNAPRGRGAAPRSCAARRRLLVPTTAPGGSSARPRPSRDDEAVPRRRRAGTTAPSAMPGASSVGRSLSEWTARSIVAVAQRAARARR